MNILQLAALLAASVALVLAGHLFRLLRWEQFIRIYERPARRSLLRGLSGGYALNFLLPFHLGDLFRAVYTGRRMKTGTGFALATVIMDRFLDVWVVALLFCTFRLTGGQNPAVGAGAAFYLVSSLVLAAALVLVTLDPVRDLLKRVCLAFCGLFNDTLKLGGMVFFWSLIHTFKDLRRVKIGRLLLNTALMWLFYLSSYAVLARLLLAASPLLQSGVSPPAVTGMADVFTCLFGRNSVNFTSLGLTDRLGLSPLQRGLFVAWFLLPLALIFLLTLLPERLRGALNQAAQPAPAGGNYLNLLPQVNPQDRSAFLSQYFGLQNKAYVNKFIEINENITILQDYSAGSNATTMLCMDTASTFYRKYAFGADGAKLAEQLDWLCRRGDSLPLCEILRQGVGDGYCWYDMAYSPQAVGMFRYLHSNPAERSAAVLRSVLDTLEERLYRPTAARADPALIRRYLETKVDANLQKLRENRILKDLMGWDKIWINGVAYRNLNALAALFDHDRLEALFADDPVSVIHGDLTIENIICRTDNDGWYLIDPNTGNLHESPFLDYGKLLQSLHGGYEFMMKTPRVAVAGNHIDFALTRSAAYDALLAAMRGYLAEHYSPRQIESIFMHEVIHWLRLMPYKLSKDKKRAPMFYAGLLMVANDVAAMMGL